MSMPKSEHYACKTILFIGPMLWFVFKLLAINGLRFSFYILCRTGKPGEVMIGQTARGCKTL